MSLLAALLLAVTLSPPFGEAFAETIGFTPTQVTIEVGVEVTEPASLVLLRVIDVAGNERGPTALIMREDGTWGAVVELPRRADLRIAFELVPPDGPSVVSDTSSLIELGIDADLLGVTSPVPAVPEPSGGSVGWIVLAVLAAVAALSLVVVWSRLGRSSDSDGIDDGWHDGFGTSVEGTIE